MNTTNPVDRPARRFIPELLLVIGLPAVAILISGALAITAYVSGFSPLPPPAAQGTPQH